MARKNTITKVIRLPDGTRKWVYAKTEAEMRTKLLQLNIQIDSGVAVNDNTTFGEFAQMWYKNYKEPTLRPNSRNALLNTLNTHLLPRFSGYRLRDITPIMIRQLLNAHKDSSRSLVSQIRCALNSIFQAAAENNLIMKSPMVKMTVGTKTKEKEPLTDAQAETILSELSKRENTQPWLFVLLGLKTGLRRGEMCGLMWSDINLDKAELRVTHNATWPTRCEATVSTDTKTETAHRTIPLTPAVVAALKAEKAKGMSLFVFHGQDGNARSQTSVRRLMDIVVKAAPKGCHVSPHILRHTFCTKLFELGFDLKEVQYLMGHATPDMTMRVYTHYRKSVRFADTAEKLRAAM